MPSPAKKRKLDPDAKNPALPSRGLEYFFSKQKQNGVPTSQPVAQVPPESSDQSLSDEQLARKLQVEWNQESRANAVIPAAQRSPSPKPKGNETTAECAAETPPRS